MLGILVVQDLALGLMLAVLPALNQPTELIAWCLRHSWVVWVIHCGAVAAGIWIIPSFLRLLARTESRELFLLGVVALCLGIAAHRAFSFQWGICCRTDDFGGEYADQTLTYVEPLRDIFATLFFAIGMLIDPVLNWS